MRRSIILSIVFMLFSSNTLANNVFPHSNNNRLNIRINNTSDAFSMPQVKVSKQNLPTWVTGFSPNEVNLGTIGTRQQATATFTFNIASNAQISASGNISFQVSAGSGDTWNKDISLSVINPNGAISGDVDGPGNSQSGATVQAVGPVTRSVTTDGLGGYIISDLPPGSYTVTVSQSGYTSNPASRQVRVTAGQTTSGVNFTLISIYGEISGDVDVEGIVTPSGAILTYTGPVSGQIILGITGWYTIDNLSAGTYTVAVSKAGYTPVPASRQVRVNPGQTTSNVNFVLIQPPQPPTLRSPENNSSVNTPRPRLDWNTAEGGGNKKYRIQVDNDSDFSSPVFDVSNITSTDYTPTSDLSNNTTYSWRVQTSNEAGTSSWSGIWNFTVRILPGRPTLSSPSNGSTISSLQPSFDWNDTSFATSYKIQVDDNSNFSSPEIDKSGLTSSSYNHTSNLSANTKYYWRVRATNAVGDGQWSDTSWFRTPSAPSTPGLSSPSNGSIIRDSNSPTLSWNSVSNASSYQIQVYKNNSIVVDTTTSNTSYTASNLDNNTTYSWRVKAINNIGASDWSNTWSFKIEMPTKGDFWFVGDLPGRDNSGVNVELWKGNTLQTSGQTNKDGDFNKPVNYEFDPGTDYRVKGWKSGYKVNRIRVLIDGREVSDINVDMEVGQQDIQIEAGKTTEVRFVFESRGATAQISLSSTSSPSTIRNAQAYSSFVKALKTMSIDDETEPLTTPVTPILSSGEVNALVTTSRPLLEVPSLIYAGEGEKPEKVVLRGTGANFTGEIFIESTTPEGTSTFHYYAVDENGSISTQIEYGEEFVIDTTIYADEGGYVSNRDGASARLQPGALPLPVNITITSPQSPAGPQRSLANTLNLPLEINDTNYVPLPDSMRQFRVQIDGKQPTYKGRSISTLNEVVDEIKGVTISLPYPDYDQDGIVDIANLDEESLKILQLRNGRWEVIENCEVDKARNIVSAQVNAFTTFMLTGAKVITDVENIVAYPNPWYSEKDNLVKITFIPLKSQPKVYIYNIAGELVRTLRDGEEIISTGQGYMEASWDGKNDSGSTVSYGIYIYVVESNKGTKKGKIGVVR